ncbi:hypothetical protein KY289_011067 [Solanum tuberosum]|nr:hypothetical protein KY289_011067 [Solanum tuberosum]
MVTFLKERGWIKHFGSRRGELFKLDYFEGYIHPPFSKVECKSHDPVLNMSEPFFDKTTEIEAQIDLNQEEGEEDEQTLLTWKQTGRRGEKMVVKGEISGVDKVAQVSEVPSVATRKHDDKGK